MALTTCPDCGLQVSDAAPSCPKCGRPFGSTASMFGPTQRTQVVELTSKKWKKMQLVGAILCLVSLVTCAGGMSAHDADGAQATFVGMLMFMGGVTLWIAGRLGAWWHHK